MMDPHLIYAAAASLYPHIVIYLALTRGGEVKIPYAEIEDIAKRYGLELLVEKDDIVVRVVSKEYIYEQMKEKNQK